MLSPKEFVFTQKLSSERSRNPKEKKNLQYIKPAEACGLFKADELKDKGQFAESLGYLSHF